MWNVRPRKKAKRKRYWLNYDYNDEPSDHDKEFSPCNRSSIRRLWEFTTNNNNERESSSSNCRWSEQNRKTRSVVDVLSLLRVYIMKIHFHLRKTLILSHPSSSPTNNNVIMAALTLFFAALARSRCAFFPFLRFLFLHDLARSVVVVEGEHSFSWKLKLIGTLMEWNFLSFVSTCSTDALSFCSSTPATINNSIKAAHGRDPQSFLLQNVKMWFWWLQVVVVVTNLLFAPVFLYIQLTATATEHIIQKMNGTTHGPNPSHCCLCEEYNHVKGTTTTKKQQQRTRKTTGINLKLSELTLITKDSGLLSMEKAARDPKISGDDQCLAVLCEPRPLPRTSTLHCSFGWFAEDNERQ